MLIEGPAVIWGAFFIFCFFFFLIDGIGKWRRRRDLSHGKFSHATIAVDLVPKLKQLLTGKATFYIVGGDGYPLTKRMYYPWWRGFLRWALRKNCTINYILTNVSPADEVALLKVKKKLELNTEGKLNFCFLRKDLVDDSDREVVRKLHTFHPLIVEEKGKRIMWLEGYHPPASTVAYGCEFVPPAVAESDRRFNDYKSILGALTAKYGSQPQLAPS
jgi:hypothetical protein